VVCEHVSLVEVSFTYSMNRQCKGMKETELLEVKRKLADALAEVDNVLTLLEVPVEWHFTSQNMPPASAHRHSRCRGKAKVVHHSICGSYQVVGVYERHKPWCS
jgi:hypothetical protein